MALGLRKKSQIILVFRSFFFFSLFTDIHLIYSTLICHTKILIKLEFGFDPVCLSVRPSTKFSGLFSAMCPAIALKLCIWLYNYDLQMKFEDGCYRPILRRVMPLEGLYSFLDFFSLCLQVSFWYLVHCFDIVRYRSSLILVLIHWFFTKLWPLDLEKTTNYQFSALFFRSAYRYSFDIWYIALQYQDTDSGWEWLWSIDFSRSYGPWT
jgi:hypothetical protein